MEKKLTSEGKQVIVEFNSTYMYDTRENANYFKKTFNELLEMGFSPRLINNCFRLYRIKSTNEYVDLFLKDKNGLWEHEFIENEENTLCDLCEEKKGTHRFESVIIESITMRNSITPNPELFEIQKKKTIDYLKSHSQHFMKMERVRSKISRMSSKRASAYKKDDLEMIQKPSHSSYFKQDAKEDSFKATHESIYRHHNEELKEIEREEEEDEERVSIKSNESKPGLQKAEMNIKSRQRNVKINVENADKLNSKNHVEKQPVPEDDDDIEEEVEDEEDEEKINEDERECAICFGFYSEATIPPFYKLLCGHFFCTECLDYHLENCINNGEVLKITCPEAICEFELKSELIVDIINSGINPNDQELSNKKIALIEKFKKFKFNKELESNKDTIFCPFPNCDGYVIHDKSKDIDADGDKINVELICNKDPNHAFCNQCKDIYHGTASCAEKDDVILKLVMDKQLKYKKCPGCKSWTEKRDGCNHMTCSHCKFEWCWVCNGKYAGNHYNIPGTKCYGRHFSDNNRDDYGEYDPKAVEKAGKGYVVPPQVIEERQRVINQPRFEQIPFYNRANLPMSSYIRLYFTTVMMPTSISNTDDCGDRAWGYILDVLFYIFYLPLVNFFGNTFFVALFYKNKKIMTALLNQRPIINFLYSVMHFVLWLIFWINCIIMSFIVVVFVMIVSCFTNVMRENDVNRVRIDPQPVNQPDPINNDRIENVERIEIVEGENPPENLNNDANGMVELPFYNDPAINNVPPEEIKEVDSSKLDSIHSEYDKSRTASLKNFEKISESNRSSPAKMQVEAYDNPVSMEKAINNNIENIQNPNQPVIVFDTSSDRSGGG